VIEYNFNSDLTCSKRQP